MRNALDTVGHPDPASLAELDLDLLQYVGQSRPTLDYVNDCRARGITVTFIFETDPNRSQQGYQAGVLDAQFWHARAFTLTDDDTAAVCASDGTRYLPSSGGERIADYGEAWARTIPNPLLAYGNRYAISSFNSGVARVDPARVVAPNLDGGWTPVPWGSDPDIDALGQEANLPSPIGGTDLNTTYHEYTGHHQPHHQPHAKVGAMVILWAPDGSTVLVVGSFIIRDFVGPKNTYGIPEDAIEYSGGDDDPNHIPLKRVQESEIKLLREVTDHLLKP